MVVEFAPAEADVEQAKRPDMGGAAAQGMGLIAEHPCVAAGCSLGELGQHPIEVGHEIVDQAIEETVAAVQLGQAREPAGVESRPRGSGP